MRKRTWSIIIFIGIVIGIVLAQNWGMVSTYFATATLNAGMILIALLGLMLLGYVIYHLGILGDILFKLGLSGIRKKGKTFTREHCIKISKEVLESEHRVETYLNQYGKTLNLAFDPVINSIKGIPFRLMIWTSIPPEADRNYNLDTLTREHFDQLFFVEVDLLDGQPSKVPFTLDEWRKWAWDKHLLSRREEEKKHPLEQWAEKEFIGGAIGEKGKEAVKKEEDKEEKE